MFVLDIFILSCSAGLSTEYRVHSPLLYCRLWSDQITGNIVELLAKRSRQTNRGVCSCWGDSAEGKTFDIYMQIFLVLAQQHFYIPSSPPLHSANLPTTQVDISNYFLVSLQDSARAMPFSPPINLFTL